MSTTPSTFTAWVRRRLGAAGDIGELARYVNNDPKWPARSSDRHTLREHLVRNRASVEVLDLFAKVWDAWTVENRGAAPGEE